MSRAFYESPLCARYAGEDMKRIFSDERKFSTWRRLWLLLAESEQAIHQGKGAVTSKIVRRIRRQHESRNL